MIDKDLASARLAEEVGVDIFVMATDIEGAMLNFGTNDQKVLHTVTLEEVTCYRKEGHFSRGSMLPKVEAAIQFVKHGGQRAVITSITAIEAAIKEKPALNSF